MSYVVTRLKGEKVRGNLGKCRTQGTSASALKYFLCGHQWAPPDQLQWLFWSKSSPFLFSLILLCPHSFPLTCLSVSHALFLCSSFKHLWSSIFSAHQKPPVWTPPRRVQLRSRWDLEGFRFEKLHS